MNDDLEAVIQSSQVAAWERYRATLPPSYWTKITSAAHAAGFKAGLEFARVANGLRGKDDA